MFFQDNEELQLQQYNNLIQISSLQSELDAVRHRVLTEDSLDQMLKEKLKTQEELLIKEREVSSNEHNETSNGNKAKDSFINKTMFIP